MNNRLSQNKPGDSYLSVWYLNLSGRRWSLTFVTPDVYSRIRGHSPGTDAWYLLEVADWDKDLVF